ANISAKRDALRRMPETGRQLGPLPAQRQTHHSATVSSSWRVRRETVCAERSYLGHTRLLGVNAPALPGGPVAIEVISSPLGETNISKVGPGGPPGGPSTV